MKKPDVLRHPAVCAVFLSAHWDTPLEVNPDFSARSGVAHQLAQLLSIVACDGAVGGCPLDVCEAVFATGTCFTDLASFHHETDPSATITCFDDPSAAEQWLDQDISSGLDARSWNRHRRTESESCSSVDQPLEVRCDFLFACHSSLPLRRNY